VSSATIFLGLIVSSLLYLSSCFNMAVTILMVDFSIIICTYNPDERLLTRCLEAVAQLDHQGFTSEVIMVDNNSRPPLSERPYIYNFLTGRANTSIVVAGEQGLAHARIAGIETARGSWAVFLDDDNEVRPEYLSNLQALIQQNPSVAAWGPGIVDVEFIDNIDPSLERVGYTTFQGKQASHIAFACIRYWQACYPFGTGLSVRIEVLRTYAQGFTQGKLSATSRKGESLASGDDIQLVMLCIREGYATGHSPDLSINHIIPRKRANIAYIKRLAYGSNADFHTAIGEIIPEYREATASQLHSPWQFTFKSIKRYLTANWSGRPEKIVKAANYIGAMHSLYRLHHKPLPKWVGMVVKQFKLR
jgi:glycosyltransferase involved in cell wall biosynthesis